MTQHHYRCVIVTNNGCCIANNVIGWCIQAWITKCSALDVFKSNPYDANVRVNTHFSQILIVILPLIYNIIVV